MVLGPAGAAAHEDQLADHVGIGQCEGHGAVTAHGVADEVHLADAQLIQHGLEAAGVQLRARTGADDGVALAPAGAAEQDHAVACLHQGADVAMEVGPAAGARARAVQHDDDFAAGAYIVVVQLQGLAVFGDGDEVAGGCFGNGCHVRSRG